MEGEDFFGAARTGSGHFSPERGKSSAGRAFGAAEDANMEKEIDLNEQLIRNKPATYFLRMKGDAMREAGIFDHDVLIVDRSVKPVNGKIIVTVLNGELLVRRFHKNFSSAFLIPENDRYKTINLSEFHDFVIWGVVTFVIHQV